MCNFLARGSLNFSKNGKNEFLRQCWSRKAIYLMYSYFWDRDNVPGISAINNNNDYTHRLWKAIGKVVAVVFVSVAGVQANLNIEIYNKGSVSVLGNDCLSQAQYSPQPSIGACKLDEDNVILVGGKNHTVFLIHEISTGSCEKKRGKFLMMQYGKDTQFS